MRFCVNCKYSRDVGPYLACYGQKNAPKVDWDYVCEDWKSEHITNRDRLRAMTDEELAEWLDNNDSYFPISNWHWLDWLKQEVDDDKR